MFCRPLLVLNCLFFSAFGSAQSLAGHIELGMKNSSRVQIANNQLQIANTNYLIFRSSMRPTLSLNGNVPVYNKDNYGITQPDGTIKFLRRSQNYSNAGFSISQPIPFTGGTVSLNTDLYRFDDFVANTKQYNGTPVFLQLQQPLFGYNSYKWDKQIEPLKLQESKLALQYEQNQLAVDICRAFFDVAEAQTAKKLAEVNLENCLINLGIEKRKVQLGTSTEDKVLQLEIQELNNRREADAAGLAIQSALIQFRLVLNSTDTSYRDFMLPENLPSIVLNVDELLYEAKKNLPLFLVFQRKQLEAKSNTSKAKANYNQISITASYGLTNAAASIPAIYQNPNDQQRFSLGFSVPLVTWGKRKNSIAVARLQENEVALQNKAEEAKLMADITMLGKQLPLLLNNITSAVKIDTLTRKRFYITNRLFQSGKASLLELQASQNEKDNARRSYILALRRFWEAWYVLRLKTNSPENYMEREFPTPPNEY